MKSILFLLILTSFNLSALDKTSTVSGDWTTGSNYTGTDLAYCTDSLNYLNSLVPTSSYYTANATYTRLCKDANPTYDSTLLSISEIIGTSSSRGYPECEPHNVDGDTRTYYVMFSEHKMDLDCTFECSIDSRQVEHSDTAVFNEDLCKWLEPCNLPTDNVVNVFDDGATTSLEQCQAFQTDLENNYNVNGNLYCYGCPGTGSTTLFQKDIVACPSGTTSTTISNASVCQEPFVSPDGFPDLNASGTPKLRLDDTPPADCIAGKSVHSSIAYAEYVGFDSVLDKCKIMTFFCNSGLTWNNDLRKCVAPADELTFEIDDSSPLTADTISSELASACSSGRWAKSWTYDYCSQSLCYIALDLQDYNLQCNNKYIEYDCTSDYRIKKFMQVSCGDVSEDDYTYSTLDGTPTSNTVADTNYTSTTTDVVSRINEGTIKTNNLLEGIGNGITDMKGSLDGIDSKLGNIQGSLDGIDSKLGNIQGSLDGLKTSLDPETSGDLDTLENSFDGLGSFLSDTQNSLNGIKSQFDSTMTLIDSGFIYTPPAVGACVDPQAVVYGHNINLVLCEPMQKFSSIFYLIFTIVFSYIAILIFILGFKI